MVLLKHYRLRQATVCKKLEARALGGPRKEGVGEQAILRKQCFHAEPTQFSKCTPPLSHKPPSLASQAL